MLYYFIVKLLLIHNCEQKKAEYFILQWKTEWKKPHPSLGFSNTEGLESQKLSSTQYIVVRLRNDGKATLL